MKKHNKQRQKTELKERESQKDLIVGLAADEMSQTMASLYEGNRVSIIISVPAKLIEHLNAMYPLLTSNRSLFLSFVLHQGKTRMIEHYAIQN